MKTKLVLLLATAAGLLPLVSQAQEATPEPAPAVSLFSRTEVRADAMQARRDGSMAVVATGYLPVAQSTLTRSEVVAELRRAQQSGEWAALNAEAVAFAPPRADESRIARAGR